MSMSQSERVKNALNRFYHTLESSPDDLEQVDVKAANKRLVATIKPALKKLEKLEVTQGLFEEYSSDDLSKQLEGVLEKTPSIAKFFSSPWGSILLSTLTGIGLSFATSYIEKKVKANKDEKGAKSQENIQNE